MVTPEALARRPWKLMVVGTAARAEGMSSNRLYANANTVMANATKADLPT